MEQAKYAHLLGMSCMDVYEFSLRGWTPKDLWALTPEGKEALALERKVAEARAKWAEADTLRKQAQREQAEDAYYAQLEARAA